VLVTVDALRADRAPSMESVRALAGRGVSFERAYAPYPSTILSFFAMMTGRAPSAIRTERWIRWDVPTADDSETLPEVLARAGWETAALAFHHIFAPEHGLTRGFRTVWTASADSRVVVQSRSSEETADRAIAFLRAVDRTRPFFLWVHFYDPHEPYLQHPEVPVEDPSDLEALYDAEVRYTDMHLTRLVEELERQGDLDRALVVLTSDHGEALGDHGLQFHASALYEEQVRVPLVVVGKGAPKGERRNTPVSLLGLAATLTDLVELPAPSSARTGSFASLVAGEPETQPPPVFAELLGDHGHQRAVVEWPWKLIHHVDHHTFELFHLERDPTERVNIYDAVPEAAERLAKLLGDWVAGQQ
jgi:arylsulfatase A-like enzyme